MRALETGTFRPVGASQDERSAFRLVTATNEGLQRLVAEGRFRADLAFRIAPLRLETTALASRPEDIEPLAQAFALAAADRRGHLTPGAVAALESMEWPGNVRQLRHFVELLVALHDGPIDAAGVAAFAGSHVVGECPTPAAGDERRRLVELLARHDGCKEAVAAALGIHLATLYRRMQRLRIPARGGR